jgi:hypothetical protein
MELRQLLIEISAISRPRESSSSSTVNDSVLSSGSAAADSPWSWLLEVLAYVKELQKGEG